MLKLRYIGYILAIIFVLALIGWVYYVPSKDIISYIRDVIFIASVVVATYVFLDWYRSNINTRWWVWGVVFWNKKGVMFSSPKLPAMIIHLVIVNPNIFTIIIDKINLTLRDERHNNYKLTATRFTDEESLETDERDSDGIPLLNPRSHFNPIIVKPTSEKIRWIVFMSQNEEPEYKKLEDMLKEGEYEGMLELMPVTGASILVKFGFKIDSSHVKDYNSGKSRIDYKNITEVSKE